MKMEARSKGDMEEERGKEAGAKGWESEGKRGNYLDMVELVLTTPQ